MEEIARDRRGHLVNGAPPAIVLVHGLWFGPWSLALLGRRLRRAGFQTTSFRYRSTRASLEQHAEALWLFIRGRGDRELHFVAHSLGGLVTLQMLAEHGDVPPGRVVLLGSPLLGSGVARKSAVVPGNGLLLGAARPGLEKGHAGHAADRDIGMIAGSRSFGLGFLLGGLGEPGDGTVAVSETRSGLLQAHLVLQVTHTGMLFSREVAREAACFLRAGSFSASP